MPDGGTSTTLLRMRVLVTGGAGFIGSHYVKRLVAAGDDVIVLDKLTYAGNPANLDGTGAVPAVVEVSDVRVEEEASAHAGASVPRCADSLGQTSLKAWRLQSRTWR